jgi:4'-phosphopantetheinyl transferase
MKILYTKISEQNHDMIVKRYVKLLSPDLQYKILKYKRWEDSQRSLLGYVLLLIGLRKFGLSANLISEILSSNCGKPYIKDNPIYFNISHSGEIVTCAINKNIEIGVDIEQIRPISFSDIKTNMLNSEWCNINKSENQLATFYHYWTQKEAVLKADGSGLNISLKSFEVKNNVTSIKNIKYYVIKLDIEKNYCCNLALKNDSFYNYAKFKIQHILV